MDEQYLAAKVCRVARVMAAIPRVTGVKRTTVNLPASVRQRLFNLATERKEDLALVLTRYALERFLYRLSLSPGNRSTGTVSND